MYGGTGIRKPPARHRYATAGARRCLDPCCSRPAQLALTMLVARGRGSRAALVPNPGPWHCCRVAVVTTCAARGSVLLRGSVQSSRAVLVFSSNVVGVGSVGSEREYAVYEPSCRQPRAISARGCANLHRANLLNADLSGAILTGADLTNAPDQRGSRWHGPHVAARRGPARAAHGEGRRLRSGAPQLRAVRPAVLRRGEEDPKRPRGRGRLRRRSSGVRRWFRRG